MPSASAKKRKANKKHDDKNRQRNTQGITEISKDEVAQKEAEEYEAGLGDAQTQQREKIEQEARKLVDNNKLQDAHEHEKMREEQAKMNAAARICTGKLGNEKLTSAVHINALSITYHGSVLIDDTDLELNQHHRYGIIGPNGCGKSTLLAALGNRDVPIPSAVDIFYLDHEMPPSMKTPLACVMDVGEERKMIEAQVRILEEEDPESELLFNLYERLDDMDADKAESAACRILKGLGFTHEMQHKPLNDFSGGWRMRVALARALFVKPYLLLLDEPTNHLDLEACVWLEEELKNFQHILMIVSHSQDFLNGVCTNIINVRNKKLEYYTGNYDQFIKTKSEVEEQQMKAYNWEQEQIANMKNYIARFGHGSAKLARQAQSKEKTLAKMIEKGLTEKVTREKTISFKFKEVDKLAPPVIQVQDISFQYKPGAPWIYKNVEFGLDLDTRLALVGPNGAGKSTLLKLLLGDCEPTDGMVRRHSHVKMGHYHQHLAERLDMNLTPLEFLMKEFNIKEPDQVRRILGRYGISGKQQTMMMRNLSEGQKCRVALSWVAQQSPHMLMLDEPTNHLDLESIDALADAISHFNGGLVLVSHDFRLISQVAKEIWICEKQTVSKWPGTIVEYKEVLKNNVLGEDGHKKDMQAASADHYNKKDELYPELKKVAPPVKKMQILSISTNKKPSTPSPTADASPSPPIKPKSNGGTKFVPPGKRSAMQNGNGKVNGNASPQSGNADDDWWG